METYKVTREELEEFRQLKGDWLYISQVLNCIYNSHDSKFLNRLFGRGNVEQDNKEQLAFSNAFMGISKIEVIDKESNSEIFYNYLKSQYDNIDFWESYPTATLNDFTRAFDSNELSSEVSDAYQSLKPEEEAEVLFKFVEHVKKGLNK